MARDRSRGPDPHPVQQLHAWRDWREDTVEMPVVEVLERDGRPVRSSTRPRHRLRGVAAGAAVLR